jgi:hypothetical protein
MFLAWRGNLDVVAEKNKPTRIGVEKGHGEPLASVVGTISTASVIRTADAEAG